jgi:hypothetical protein
MSKERAQRRAEERAKKHAPKTRPADSSETEPSRTRTRPGKNARVRSAREQRTRRRMTVVALLWVVANAVIWLLTDTWNARWLGLTITTILVPVIVWLVWDPEGRVDL